MPGVYLNWMNDEECVAVAEFVIGWIHSDLSRADHDNVALTAAEAKDISLYAFLCDILVCVDGDNAERAQELLSKIGQ